MQTEQVLPVRSPQPLYRRDGLGCALLMALCFLLIRPFVEMGVIDDWSYIKTAQVFADTGHFVYNGWATAMLGWQVPWGALFSKLLGFSFVHVRLSTLPLALGAVYLFHQILRRFGIARGYAVFGTLTLALSPLFIALSATYMTDIPGLFCMLLCLYLCQRALAAPSGRQALGWLCLAALTNVVGGTCRQVIWLGVLVMVPSAVWLLRRHRTLLWSGGLLWLAGAASALFWMRWFNHQPYFLPTDILPHVLTLGVLKHLLQQEVIKGTQAVLCLLLLLLPVLVAWWPLVRSLPPRLLLWPSGIAAILLTGILLYSARKGMLYACTAPWLQHVLGSLRDGVSGNIAGSVPFALENGPRVIATYLVLGSGLVFFVHLFSRVRQHRRLPEAQATAWQPLFWLLGPYALSYAGALVIQQMSTPIFDRYLLPLQVIGTIVLLRYYQELAVPDRNPERSVFRLGGLPLVSYLALLAFTCYAITGVHDWFSFNRARLAATEQVRRAGVPRTAISAGFEYDGWTQLEAAGYLDDPRIRIPADAFHPVHSALTLPPECTTWFPAALTPAVAPRYFVVSAPLSCFAPAPFPPITYAAWLPPFTRQVYVQQLQDTQASAATLPHLR